MDEIEQEQTVEETEPTAEELKAQLEEMKAQRDKQFERAKKAEGFVKQSDGTWKKPEAKVDTKQDLIPADPVEVATLANSLRDLSPEEIDFAKLIAKGSSTSLLEAIKTDGFQAYHDAQDAKRKKENAKLGASKGSSQQEVSGIRPGMTKEEHEAEWRKTLN